MFDVEIINYESISHAKISIEGFTTLVGRNHIGKSSVMRAINAALTNQQGTHFIRWGCDYCEVRIKTHGLDLTWHKEEGKNYYAINGQNFEKIGREQPPSAISQAGFRLLQIADQKINLNYSQQFFPLFLVDKRDTKTADLLTSVYGLDTLYNSIRFCNKEQRNVNDQLQLRKKDLNVIEEDLEKFRGFEEAYKKISDLRKQQKTIASKEASTAKLESSHADILRLIKACKILKKASTVTVPDVKPIRASVQENVNLTKVRQTKLSLEEDLQSLDRAVKAKLPATSEPIRKEIGTLKQLLSLRQEYVHLLAWVRKLKKASDIKVPAADIDVNVVMRLEDWNDTIQKGKKDLIGLKRTVQSTEKELKEVSEEMASYKNCPLCKRAF